MLVAEVGVARSAGVGVGGTELPETSGTSASLLCGTKVAVGIGSAVDGPSGRGEARSEFSDPLPGEVPATNWVSEGLDVG